MAKTCRTYIFEIAVRTHVYDMRDGTVASLLTGKVCDRRNDRGYVIFDVYESGKCHRVKAHQFAWYCCHGVLPDKDIDHIDGNKSNNRIDNLRLCEPYENNVNRDLGTGVSFDREKKCWRAQVWRKGKIFRTRCHSWISAATIVQMVRRQWHGEFFRDTTLAGESDGSDARPITLITGLTPVPATNLEACR